MARNLSVYGPFAALERVLMALVKAGANRQEMHERLRQHALNAWRAVQAGDENPILEQLILDEEISAYISRDSLYQLMDAGQHLGDAPERARQLAGFIRRHLGDGE